MKTILIFALSGALLGIALVSWVVPPALTWYTTPGGLPKGTQIQTLVQIEEVIRYSTGKLIQYQAIGAAVGAVAGLVSAILFQEKESGTNRSRGATTSNGSMTPLRSLAGIAVLSAALAAQTPQEFEVASIRPSPEQVQTASIGLHISAAQIRISYLSLKDYIGMAYDVPAGRVEGPDWLAQARFDISAKLPDGASRDNVAPMLRKLLADRFELKVHRESRDLPVYALSVGKDGPKLKPLAADDAAPSATVNVAGSGNQNGVSVDLGGGASFTLAGSRLEMKKSTMKTLADTLTRLMDRPVIDASGVAGTYDLVLDLIPEDYNAIVIRSAVNAGVTLPPQALRALDGAAADPFSAALQKFGLTLVSRKSPLDVIIVDSTRRTPTDN